MRACVHGYRDPTWCPECKAPPNEKATSPAAGLVSSAGATSPLDGTEKGPATVRGIPLGNCVAAIHMQAGRHMRQTDCDNWVPAVRTAVHTESANDKQVGGEHYKIPIQTWDFITANRIGFLEGNAIKYIVRHKSKGGKQDLEKAIHYLQKALEVYYPEEKS